MELRAGGERKTVNLATARGRIEDPDSRAVLREGADLTLSVSGGKPVRMTAAAGGAVKVDGRAYAGSITVFPKAGGTLRIVNTVPLDDYLAGVLAGELFPDAPPEALRALTILARSFALIHLSDLTDDPGVHQAYRGVPAAAVQPILRAAVASTAGMRLLDRAGGPLPNYWYHSTCGGHTTEAAVVFGAPDSEAYGGVPCAKCSSSKYWRWDAQFPETEMRRALRFGSPVVRLEVGSRSMDGRLLTFRATAAGGTVKYVPALQVRQALGANRLRSTFVSSIVTAGSGDDLEFRFEGRGWGHGVGLCQIGACAMAKEGADAERILAFYYPGTKVVKARR